MAKRSKLLTIFSATTLAISLIVLSASIWARVQVSENRGWSDRPWKLSADASLPAQIQRNLDIETAGNPNVLGQSLHVLAPRLKIDTTFVSGPDLRPTDDIRVASNIKTFVAAAALKLVEQGKLSLDAPIGPYVSEPMRKILAKRTGTLEKVTLRQLLNHTSGIPDYGNSPVFQTLAYVPTAFGWAPHWTAQQQVWIGARLLPNTPPGVQFDYSDTNYLLASDMIAKATGLGNAGLALSHLLNWRAIGADETYWEGYEEPPIGTRRIRQFRGAIEDTNLDVSFDQYGGGGLVMSLDDLSRAHRAIMRGEVFADPTKTLTEMKLAGSAEGSGSYGLGISETFVEGVSCWGHGGRWGTIALYCPSIDLTVSRSLGQSNVGLDFSDPSGPIAALVLLLR
jgi:D-alanyl-D-alanine carboxypeptidase